MSRHSLDELSPKKRALLELLRKEQQARKSEASTAARPMPDDAWIAEHSVSAQARLRLFCFPYAGGGASVYRPWQAGLPPTIEVCPIQLPGREKRVAEPLHTDIMSLVQAIAHAIAPYTNQPFAFFGHSMGALICFEVARELRRLGQPAPVQLFISSYRAPHTLQPHPSLQQATEDAFVEQFRRFIDMPDMMAEEFLRMTLPILRADIAVCDSYHYRDAEPLDCPISAFRGLQDHVTQSDIVPWQVLTRGAFTLRVFPGDHFFWRDAQQPLLQAVQQDLAPVLAQLAPSIHGSA